MKLFQIEEPDGSPADPDAPGAAVGIDASDRLAEVAIAVGGNAMILADREGFERDLPAPALDAPPEAWRALFEGARLRAERGLARPVTHAVLAVSNAADAAISARLVAAATEAGLTILSIVPRRDLADAEPPACAAAIIAEDAAPSTGF